MYVSHSILILKTIFIKKNQTYLCGSMPIMEQIQVFILQKNRKIIDQTNVVLFHFILLNIRKIYNITYYFIILFIGIWRKMVKNYFYFFGGKRYLVFGGK